MLKTHYRSLGNQIFEYTNVIQGVISESVFIYKHRNRKAVTFA